MGSIRYDFPQNTRSSLELLYLARSEYDASWHSIVHTHPHVELFYCLEGRGILHVEGQDIPIRQDDLILINPFVEHTERSLPDNGLHYVVLGIRGLEFLSPGGNTIPYHLLNFRKSRGELLPYLFDLIREADARQADYIEVCHHILSILLSKVYRHSAFDLTCAPARSPGKNCMDIKRYIDAHFTQPLSLDQLAERTHISKYHLVHAFRRAFGVPPMSYLLDKRIRESCHLLEQTNHRLADISNMVGFSSPSYFSQCFRRMVGKSPADYRRACRDAQARSAPQADDVPLQPEPPA